MGSTQHFRMILGFIHLNLLCVVVYGNHYVPKSSHLAEVKRSIQEINSSYDYIIIGGGTSGLTVADRLTEDPSKSVLVVELGYFGDEPCIFMPLNSVTGSCSQFRFNISTTPQVALNNFTLKPFGVGAIVGGSSAVNGMFFDRAPKIDYDMWEKMGNPSWNWNGLLPYFKKGITFTPPSQEVAAKYGYTWDASSAYGDGPINASYPPFQWPTTLVLWEAWKDLGITVQKEGAAGDAYGLFWVPGSEDPVNMTRSYARWGHYEPVKTRPNYHLLIGHKAERLQVSPSLTAEGVIIHHRDDPNTRFTVTARLEVVLAAGALNTPRILQLSGIGPKNILARAGVEVRLDLPGVGQNYQDHAQARYVCNFTQDLYPNIAQLSNATFTAAALAEYYENKTGPLTLPLGNAGAFLPLKTVHEKWRDFISSIDAQESETYLEQGLDKTVVAGYATQKKILSLFYSSEKSAVYETPFGASCSRTIIMLHPFSRGSVNINASDPTGDPVFDLRSFTNPLDIDLASIFLRYTRRYINTPTLSRLGPVEQSPGPDVTGDAEFEAYVRNSSYPTSFHACCTASMMPLDKGGVVGPDLLVHGLRQISIIDASIMPIIPATHLSATVYAVAEKAADIIKERHSKAK